MAKRLSMVDSMNLNDVISSSIVQIGDSVRVSPRSRAFAVKKEFPFFSSNERNLPSYGTYSQQIPKVLGTQHVNMSVHNEVPVIKVGQIRIVGTAASSIIHIGSTQSIDSEALEQNARHFLFPPEEYETH